MKKLTMIAAILGTVGTLAVAAPEPASARDAFSFSFSVGDVDMAYRNGFYDRYGRWHYWRNPREMSEFRARYSSRYRDMDRDGVPNSYDRDRDGDGVPNAYDSRPNNSYGGYNRGFGFSRSRSDWDGDGVRTGSTHVPGTQIVTNNI